jgi:hypothetical protein
MYSLRSAVFLLKYGRSGGLKISAPAGFSLQSFVDYNKRIFVAIPNAKATKIGGFLLFFLLKCC